MKPLFGTLFSFILFVSCSSTGGEVMLVSENSNSGFNFPYFLFIPEEANPSNSVFLIVEPNNTGSVSDNLADHKDKAENLATNNYNLGNYLAHQLGYPLLIPIFPRAEATWKIYTHALDRDAMQQKGNAIERIDLQLLAMVEDAKGKLDSIGYSMEEQIVLTGFSASGSFTNRFTAIHPEKVAASIAGGLNGMLILPKDSLGRTALNYPIGINDFLEITGKSFDSITFKNTPQFLFMGELDDNDAANYDDAYTDEDRTIIFKELGKQMQPDRWETCTGIYKDFGVNAELKTYENIGHEPSLRIKQDILEFLKNSL
ncbi:hypothetical protein [Aegicerativicinus sediminis]|uniref:hypothetical protein n=1 Tax=Aegicerativicinus sediminis TaxID=2893202 RepID=UPI001E62998C|nr:hypothetical protein [Aegicerativicinus sediminis]